MGANSPVMLLGQKSVQEELKLSGDQIKKAEELAAKQRETLQSLRDLDQEERGKKMQEINQANQKSLAEILKPNQVKRLRQISLQLAGAQAFNNPEVAAELKLTDDQKEKIREIRQQTNQQAQSIRENTSDRTEARQKVEQLNKSTAGKVIGLLTAEQKEKWKELIGEPFKGEIIRGRRGGAGASR
jgi:hypothetical protein